MIFIDGLRLENAREPDFAYTTRNTNLITADEILQTEFKLKDTIEIPVHGEQHSFVVENVRPLGNGRKKVYFVSRNIVGMSSMIPEQINSFLDDFEGNMPREIVDIMEPIEHKRFGFEFTRKLNLLSSANLRGRDGYDGYDGYDDVLFGELETKVERCKRYNGKVSGWWLCDLWWRSSNISSITSFMGVSACDGIYSYNAYYVLGIVPNFSIITEVNRYG